MVLLLPLLRRAWTCERRREKKKRRLRKRRNGRKKRGENLKDGFSFQPSSPSHERGLSFLVHSKPQTTHLAPSPSREIAAVAPATAATPSLLATTTLP